MGSLFEGRRELVAYAVFGVLTTLVNIAAYWVLAHPLGIDVVVASAVAWFLSVLFAYVTNRRWVFGSSASGAAEVLRECVSFFAARIATGALDLAIMWLAVDVLTLPDLPVKVASNVLVIVLNFVASKLVVFRSGK